mgnify:CR=1 FL=1
MMHWIEKTVEDVVREFGERSVIVCNGGLSVSGLQHVGRIRGEITFVGTVCKILREKGYEAKHTLVLYTQDPWKGKPSQLMQFKNPEEAKSYHNYPLIRVPDPEGCHDNWVEHYWEDFGNYLDEFYEGINVVYTHELYRYNDEMKRFIIDSIVMKEKIREVINKYRGRTKLPADWIPFEPICEKCGRIGTSKVLDVDLNEYKVKYRCSCGFEGKTSMENGKLMWRLEWVAVWRVLNVSFEPYGKDHATPGGSRDSCNDLALNVFGFNPPVGLAYEWVGYVKGGVDMGDMGSSDFIGFTPKKWLEVAEPEVLKFLYLLNPPMKRIVLSLERVPLYVDRYDRAERLYYGIEKATIPKEKLENIVKSYVYAQKGKPPKDPPYQISFLHAVALVQTIPDTDDIITEAIKRIEKTTKRKLHLSSFEIDRLKRRLTNARNWLINYAPHHYKISVLEKLSEDIITRLDPKILPLIKELYANFQNIAWEEEEIKRAMINVKRRDRKEEILFFKTLYLVFFGREYGPRIAPYLSILDKEFVLNRLQETIRVLSLKINGQIYQRFFNH